MNSNLLMQPDEAVYDPDALAALALQVYARGLDTWQPFVAAKNLTGLCIVSSHRRHMPICWPFPCRIGHGSTRKRPLRHD